MMSEYCTNLLISIQPLLFVLDLFFIEMLDKLITYIVCSYNTFYEVSAIVWLKLLLNLQYNLCL